MEAYRSGFRPSAWGSEPYVIVAGTVAVAATQEEARRLLVPEAWSMAYARTHGSFPPLMPAERIEASAMTEKERALFEEGLRGHLAGTDEAVEEGLAEVLEETGADEILVTTSTYDRGALVDSMRSSHGSRASAEVSPRGGRTRGRIPGELQQKALQQLLARGVGHHAEHRTGVPGGRPLGRALDPRGDRAHESFGAERLGGLQGVQEDQRERLRKPGGQLVPFLADQMRPEQRQHHA